MSDAGRAERMSRDVIIGLVLLAVAVLLGLSRCAGQQPATTTPPATSTTPSGTGASVQPDQDGYRYLVSRERYVVQHPDSAQPEIQTRLRESWSATDEWTWARQTGSDPAHFIFAPDADAATIRQSPPDPVALDMALRSRVRAGERARGEAPATEAELDNILFDFIYQVLALDYRPPSALPEDYRAALVDLLAGLDGATRTADVADPEGRTATRVTYLNRSARPGWTQHLYLDGRHQFLAYSYAIDGTEDRGAHIVTERNVVSTIPDDVLAVLGSEREAKELWKCPDSTDQC
jgi:hypothetical protein